MITLWRFDWYPKTCPVIRRGIHTYVVCVSKIIGHAKEYGLNSLVYILNDSV
jgi:hypothetical protein